MIVWQESDPASWVATFTMPKHDIKMSFIHYYVFMLIRTSFRYFNEKMTENRLNCIEYDNFNPNFNEK